MPGTARSAWAAARDGAGRGSRPAAEPAAGGQQLADVVHGVARQGVRPQPPAQTIQRQPGAVDPVRLGPRLLGPQERPRAPRRRQQHLPPGPAPRRTGLSASAAAVGLLIGPVASLALRPARYARPAPLAVRDLRPWRYPLTTGPPR